MLKYKLILICIGLFLGSSLLALTPTNDIRVAIARSIGSADISGELVVSVPGVEGRGYEKIETHRARVVVTPAGFDVNGHQILTSAISIINKNNKTIFNRHTYHGEIRLYKDGKNAMMAVNILPLPEYLTGLLSSEIPLDWPKEAIKAQAVAARTYALFQKKAKAGTEAGYNYDLEATVLDQVYEGSGSDDERARNAVEDTMGEVLMRHGSLVKTFFHSTCGGQTETALNVWGEQNSFTSVKDPYCSKSPYSIWTYSTTKKVLASKIRTANFPAETIVSIQTEARPGSPRAATVIIDTGSQTLFLQGNDFRRIVGYDNIKSTWFNIKVEGEAVVFTGRGYGHGVGMCQWGAKGMAGAGKTYHDILRFYYPGVRIEKAKVW